jgi:folate-binding protein YgfZ
VSADFHAASLRELTPVLITGNDARKFLQGQLSNDVRALTKERALLASCTSGQGRVLSVLTLLDRPEGIFAIMPTATLELTLARMRRMLLRSQVSFDELHHAWVLAPVTATEAQKAFDSLPERPGACLASASASLLRWWSCDERYLMLVQRAQSGLADEASSTLDAQWRRADIAAGLPSVYPATRESFVPQMLNLDLLHGVSYDKGCYVGQEVVARARRAQVKRRMFRFEASCSPPAPGTQVLLEQSPVGEVVDAAATSCGCELLAVVDIDRHTAALALPEGPVLRPLGLPYRSEG